MYIVTTHFGIQEIDHISGLGFVYVKLSHLKYPYQLSVRDSAKGKRGETIKELCDRFIYYNSETKQEEVIDNLDVDKQVLQWRNNCFNKQDKIYGEVKVNGEWRRTAEMDIEGNFKLL